VGKQMRRNKKRRRKKEEEPCFHSFEGLQLKKQRNHKNKIITVSRRDKIYAYSGATREQQRNS
jgi:hypothetical protein